MQNYIEFSLTLFPPADIYQPSNIYAAGTFAGFIGLSSSLLAYESGAPYLNFSLLFP